MLHVSSWLFVLTTCASDGAPVAGNLSESVHGICWDLNELRSLPGLKPPGSFSERYKLAIQCRSLAVYRRWCSATSSMTIWPTRPTKGQCHQPKDGLCRSASLKFQGGGGTMQCQVGHQGCQNGGPPNQNSKT